jgi:hypothetical protein
VRQGPELSSFQLSGHRVTQRPGPCKRSSPVADPAVRQEGPSVEDTTLFHSLMAAKPHHGEVGDGDPMRPEKLQKASELKWAQLNALSAVDLVMPTNKRQAKCPPAQGSCVPPPNQTSVSPRIPETRLCAAWSWPLVFPASSR